MAGNPVPTGVSDSNQPILSWYVTTAESVEAALEAARELGFHGLHAPVSQPPLDAALWDDAVLNAARCGCAERGLRLSLQVTLPGMALWSRAPDLTRGVMVYAGRVVSAAERIGAARLVVTACCPTVGHECSCQSARASEALHNALRENVMRLVGLAVQRSEVCLDARSLTPPSCQVLEPLLCEGFLTLGVDLEPDGTFAVAEGCGRFLHDWAHRIRVVRTRPGTDFNGLRMQAVLADLVQLGVAEWTVIAPNTAVARAMRQQLQHALVNAEAAVTGRA